MSGVSHVAVPIIISDLTNLYWLEVDIQQKESGLVITR